MGYTPTAGSARKFHIFLASGSPLTYTEIPYGSEEAPDFLLSGSIRYNSSLTTRGTLTFSIYSDIATFIPVVGQPVLMTHDDMGNVFGGMIQQVTITNYPGHPRKGVYSECQCVDWSILASRRLLVLSGAFPLGNVNDSGQYDGTNNPFPLTKLPTAIASIKVNGSDQTFGPWGQSGVDWWWMIAVKIVYKAYGIPLGSGDWIQVSYDTVGDTTPVAPSYSNKTAAEIARAIGSLLNPDGVYVYAPESGPTVDLIAYNDQDTVASALDALCQYINNGTTNFWWYIDADKILHFEPQALQPAPWDISTLDGSDGNVLIQISNTLTMEKFANAAWVRISNAKGTSEIPDIFQGDGTTQSFNTTYPVAETPRIILYGTGYPPEGTPQTVGLKGTTGYQWYWTPNSTTVEQDPGQTPMPSGVYMSTFYIPMLALTQFYVNKASATARSHIEGGSGEYDTYFEETNALPFILTRGMNLAQNIAEYYAAMSQKVSLQTYRWGLQSGMAIIIDLPEIQASGIYIVDQVSITDSDNMALWSVDCISGAVIGDWKTALKGLTVGAGGVASVVNSGGVSDGVIAHA